MKKFPFLALLDNVLAQVSICSSQVSICSCTSLFCLLLPTTAETAPYLPANFLPTSTSFFRGIVELLVLGFKGEGVGVSSDTYVYPGIWQGFLETFGWSSEAPCSDVVKKCTLHPKSLQQDFFSNACFT